MSAAEEVKAGQAATAETNSCRMPSTAPDKLRQAAVERFQSAQQLLATKQAATELQEYRTWVLDIAKAVAEAAKEGDFLEIKSAASVLVTAKRLC